MKVYEAFSVELMTSLDPKTPLERELAKTVVDQQWRLNRIRSSEDGMLALSDAALETGANHPAVDSTLAAAQAFLQNSKAFVNLTIYEQRIHRIMEKALAQNSNSSSSSARNGNESNSPAPSSSIVTSRQARKAVPKTRIMKSESC